MTSVSSLRMCRSRGLAEISWRTDVEQLLVQAAIGTPDCLELRRILDETADDEAAPQGPDLLAADAEMALVEPLARWGHYPVLNDIDLFPFTSDRWE